MSRPELAAVHPEPPPDVGRLVLLGHPVAHSLSPRFQNAALDAAGIRLRYQALDVAPDRLGALWRDLAAARAAGNVTVPHKADAARACAALTPRAAAVGAVNTFWHDARGRLVGDNTDVGGFAAAVAAVVDPAASDGRWALVGAGGSAAAVLVAAAGWPGTRLRVWSRTRARADALARLAPGTAVACDRLADALAGATLVVNATSLGLKPDDALPVPIAELPAGCAVYDLVYAPARTPWVRSARRAGHRADDGLAMLVEQGALAFERWFGRPPSRDAMWAALADVVHARADA